MKISQKEVIYIRKNLPSLEHVLLDDDSSDYNVIAISIFDHWLSKEEMNQIYISDQKVVAHRREKFEQLVQQMFSNTSVFSFRLKKRKKLFFTKSSMTNDFRKRCNFDKMTEETGYNYALLLPELSAIYISGFDWTNKLLYLDRSKIENIISITESIGLYTIDYE